MHTRIKDTATAHPLTQILVSQSIPVHWGISPMHQVWAITTIVLRIRRVMVALRHTVSMLQIQFITGQDRQITRGQTVLARHLVPWEITMLGRNNLHNSQIMAIKSIMAELATKDRYLGRKHRVLGKVKRKRNKSDSLRGLLQTSIDRRPTLASPHGQRVAKQSSIRSHEYNHLRPPLHRLVSRINEQKVVLAPMDRTRAEQRLRNRHHTDHLRLPKVPHMEVIMLRRNPKSRLHLSQRKSSIP